MQFALVNGERSEARPGERGTCETCGAEMVAKCGSRVINHWAHASKTDCDPWWENETLWHREWKNLFPEECREIHHVSSDGEIHRADIKTPTGIYIEIQHSPMSDFERIAREKFYKNLIWIIDGRGFRKNFDIYHMLPAPESELAQDLVWSKAKRSMQGAAAGLFFRVSANQDYQPGATKETLRGGYIESIHTIKDKIEETYRGHHQYDWVRPRKTWLDAECPVYIDFGDDYLVKLEVYDETALPCIRFVSKKKLLHDSVTETSADSIASCFYPFP